MNFFNKIKRHGVYIFACVCLPLSVAQVQAVEITPYVGQMFSSDLRDGTSDTDLAVDSATSIGLGIAWQDTPRGQGQVLINYVSHDFENLAGDQEHSLDIIYAHFNGIAQFKQQNYVTTFSIGLGGAYMDSDLADDIYPSATIAIGTRYEFSNNMALVTELRTYATLVDEDEQLFCANDSCAAQFDEALWYDTSISIGIAYRF
ncbi:hypothetical protein [Thalassotalea sp. PLHSN55]|uniref:hypothetical protein n=1 Tax=Thalassotalea sp. PLHSN55 TaxID=3435888 RepID=UPI003F83A1E9